MSETNQENTSPSVEELEKQIQRLERARERERKAKEKAEELLEVKSRELFQAGEELRLAEEKYRGIFEHSIDGIYQTTPDGQYLSANPALARIRGYVSPEELIQRVDDLSDASYVDHERREEFKRLLNDNESLRGFESQIRQKDGTIRWVSENARVVRDTEGKVVYYEGAIQDITQRKEAEQALNQSKEELEIANQQLKQTQAQMVHSEKMAGLGQMAAGVAHEINNPVGFIMSNLSTMKEYVDIFKQIFESYNEVAVAVESRDADKLKKSLHQVKSVIEEEDLDFVLEDVDQLLQESSDGANRVKEIVLGLRNFARLDEAEVKEADINEGIESTLKVIWNELKYKCEVHKDFGDLPQLVCHPAQLNQVFMNILTNAAQAIKEKGDIHIATKATKDDIVVQISDTGQGIPQENLNKLFEPFFTTKSVGTGTGLGLAISHGIIENHGGTIDVESEVGKGTTFSIRLPLTGSVSDG